MSIKIRAFHHDHTRIARGAVSVGAFVLAGRLVGAAKEMAVAWRYGVSDIVDAYQIAFTLVTWLPVTLVSVVSVILVPHLVRERQRVDGASNFLAELNFTMVALGSLFSCLCFLLLPWAVNLVAGNLPTATRVIAKDMVIMLAPAALCTLVVGVLAARLQALERHVNVLLEAVPAAIIIVCLLLWTSGHDMTPLVWGTVLGITVQAVWLGALVRRQEGSLGGLRPSFSADAWGSIFNALGVMALGQFAMSWTTPLDQYTAAQLGENAVATLGYANRIVALLNGIGAIAIARATLPVLSETLAKGETKRAWRQAQQWSWLMLGLGTAAIVVGWLLAPLGVRLLFERGAFTPTNTIAVAQVLRLGLLQLPFFFGGLVLVQLFAGSGKYKNVAMVGFIVLALKIPLNLILSSFIGTSGIMLATAFSQVGAFLWLLLRARKSMVNLYA